MNDIIADILAIPMIAFTLYIFWAQARDARRFWGGPQDGRKWEADWKTFKMDGRRKSVVWRVKEDEEDKIQRILDNQKKIEKYKEFIKRHKDNKK